MIRNSAYALLIFIILIGLSSQTTFAQSAMTIFDIGGGVRALAMGEAFVGLADDEQAALYNPAGLGFLDGIHASANYERHLGVSNYLSLLGGMRSVGVSLLLFSLGSIEQRDSSDNVMGTFSYSNFAITAAGGTALSALPLSFTRSLDSFSLGSRFKFLSVSSLEGGSGSAVALDISGLLRAESILESFGVRGIDLMQWGFNIENLISLGVGYSGRSERLPFKFKTGFAVRPIPDLTMALDFAIPFELHIGAEYQVPVALPISGVAVRAGGFSRGGTFAFTAGFGIANEPFRLDYAFTSHSRLPGSHRLAFAMSF
jgi:hypothetical protein